MSHVLWRVATAVPVLFGVLLAGFVLTRILPGDPAVFFAANPAMSVEDVAQLRADLGLDAPLGVQFLTYLGALARGDLGYSQERLLLGGGYTRLAQSLYPDDPDGVERVLNGHCAMVAFDLPGGGSVFNVGSCEWPYGLQSGDPFVDRITRNVLDRFLQTEN